jgi:hypothetical protein
MEFFTTIGLGIGLVLAGFSIVAALYFSFYHVLPSVDRALTRALYSDDEPRNG